MNLIIKVINNKKLVLFTHNFLNLNIFDIKNSKSIKLVN